ncbi:MBL fold metallo-hydrolase [Dethiobacter alkaliphilus]|uniref:MBL fold metallo-hydrolase n=1 Tax=Dethiobacter alkaliphilus TaxID=427926 RepID=UPI002227C31F|nr:MBL fold metallo-hydrolase [Dethiobacter alkaliphilus]MCW3489597.1 MBL fold metallo-hydrolase [Dethiobacter alkaliphilus]
MQLTVLGCFGPYPRAGQSCSGYLVQEGDSAVLLDCGNGVLSRLRYYIEPWNLDAVVLSHLHSDHVSDMMIIRYAMMVKRYQEPGPALKVYAPADPQSEYDRLAYKDFVATYPVTEDTCLRLGNMEITFSKGAHPVLSHLITIQSGEKKLVYSGDTEYFPEMSQRIKGADLFLCEANYLREDIQKGHVNHLAAYQAANAALEGEVKRLVLTHHHPDRNQEHSLQEAREIFTNTELAVADQQYTL